MLWNAKYPKAITLPHSWQQIQNGERYCNALTAYFSAWYPKILGNQVLNLGGLSAEISRDIHISHHDIVLSPQLSPDLIQLAQQPNTTVVQANLTELPFIEHAVDACILANTLNFSQDPHQILRETDRVLCEEGYLFLSIFNPFSNLLFKRFLHKKNQPPLAIRHYFPLRIIDWLSLLNFDVLEHRGLLPYDRMGCFPQLIAIVARKRIYPLTLNPEKVRFKKQAVFAPVSAFKTK
ncbi:class I SAM-dependent methyltransferase [Pasteurella sp. PK-2025]|uniref:class I SAM-dependent methyltransferase n=1 Tax=unclassified Pasteurella TaxID=2621516 RepID=UPI003C783BC2